MSTKQRLFEIMGKVDPNFKTNIPDLILKRVPFFKEYNIFENAPDRLEAQRIVTNTNVKMYMGGELINFEQFNISSEFYYYTQHIHDNIFYNFVLKNKFYPTKPKEIDDLTYTVFIYALRMMEEKYSYHNDIMVRDNETLGSEAFNKVINEINSKMFEIEEYTKKNNLNLF